MQEARGSNPLRQLHVKGRFRTLDLALSVSVQQPWPLGCLPSRQKALQVLAVGTALWASNAQRLMAL